MSGRAIDGLRRFTGLWLRQVRLRNGVVASACVLAAIGALFIWQASLLDLGDFGLPGPGFFPLALAILVVALSIIIALGQWRTVSNDESFELGHRDVLIVFAAGLMVPLLFDLLGAYITLGLFGVVVLILVARVSPLVSIAACALGMVASFYFFQVLLGLQMPTGPF